MTPDHHELAALGQLGGFDRARFEESIELARTQLAFPLPEPEPATAVELDTELDTELEAAIDPAIDDEERER